MMESEEMENWNRFKTDPRWKKYEKSVFNQLIKTNRYSKYINFDGWIGDEMMYLQAFILADLGDTIMTETNSNPDDVIHLFERFFENNISKTKNILCWRGIDARGIRSNLPQWTNSNKQIPTPHKLGAEISLIAKKTHMIDIRLIANRQYYVSNGYKELLKDNY